MPSSHYFPSKSFNAAIRLPSFVGAVEDAVCKRLMKKKMCSRKEHGVIPLEWPLGECGRKLVIGPITNNRPILLLIIGPSMDGSHTMEGICKF